MGRIFANCKEAINEIERDIMEMGIQVHPHSMQNKIVEGNEDFSTLEVQNYTFTILNTNDKNMIVPKLDWCEADFKERIDRKQLNPGEAWKLRAEVWEEFLIDVIPIYTNPERTRAFDYTYSERINEFAQLDRVIDELRKNPDTRQAIIQIHWASDSVSMGGKARIPCSVYYQLMIRRGKLDIIYNMRSSDFDTHFCNDIWMAAKLRDYIAAELDIEPGLFHMNVGSLHRYKNYTRKHVF